jgi:ABC-2 type transport system ATP-binding protein
MNAIEVNRLSRAFNGLQAVDNISFSVEAGEIIGYLGHNGAGKTTTIRMLSGQLLRLLIARALLHRPQIIFLDEPTRGLDPVVGREIRRLILDLSQQGVTIFLTTHYMEEADQLCSRVAFLSDGRIVALDTPNALKVAHGQKSIRVTLDDGESLNIALDDQDAGKQLEKLVNDGHVRTLHSAEATLEDVFIQIAGRKLSE